MTRKVGRQSKRGEREDSQLFCDPPPGYVYFHGHDEWKHLHDWKRVYDGRYATQTVRCVSCGLEQT